MMELHQFTMFDINQLTALRVSYSSDDQHDLISRCNTKNVVKLVEDVTSAFTYEFEQRAITPKPLPSYDYHLIYHEHHVIINVDTGINSDNMRQTITHHLTYEQIKGLNIINQVSITR